MHHAAYTRHDPRGLPVNRRYFNSDFKPGEERFKMNHTPRQNNVPIPAYGTTRYIGGTHIKESVNKYLKTSPRNVHSKRPMLSKSNRWSKISESIREAEERDICGSAESSVVSVCGEKVETSNICICETDTEKGEVATKALLRKVKKELDLSSGGSSSVCCVNWKQVYPLYCTDTELDNSHDEMVNPTSLEHVDICECEEGEEFDPHPREERCIRGKDPAPPGYDITLILPQYVSIKNSVECKSCEISTESVNSCEEKLDNADNLMCMPNITELSWDVLQYGMHQKIPEKYTSDLFK